MEAAQQIKFTTLNQRRWSAKTALNAKVRELQRALDADNFDDRSEMVAALRRAKQIEGSRKMKLPSKRCESMVKKREKCQRA